MLDTPLTSPTTTCSWSTTTHLTLTCHLPLTPIQLHQTLHAVTHTSQQHPNTWPAASPVTQTPCALLQDLQSPTPTRQRFLHLPLLDDSDNILGDPQRDNTFRRQSLLSTSPDATDTAPESAQLTATQGSDLKGNTGTTLVNRGAGIPTCHT